MAQTKLITPRLTLRRITLSRHQYRMTQSLHRPSTPIARFTETLNFVPVQWKIGKIVSANIASAPLLATKSVSQSLVEGKKPVSKCVPHSVWPALAWQATTTKHLLTRFKLLTKIAKGTWQELCPCNRRATSIGSQATLQSSQSKATGAPPRVLQNAA